MSKTVLEFATNTKHYSLFLHEIAQLDKDLTNQYKSFMRIDHKLNRKLVSFQANKTVPFYRWYKYKEGFSSSLVNHYIRKHGVDNTKLLMDPFAGSGATLFGASDLGIDALGIELLPIGQHIIKARYLLNTLPDNDFERLAFWRNNKPWIKHDGQTDYTILKITSGAYSPENSMLIKKYLSCMKNENENIQTVDLFNNR